MEGQIRRQCALHPDCHPTCNASEPQVCPLVCIPNGCECPPGTVIDEAANECVCPDSCSGNKYK